MQSRLTVLLLAIFTFWAAGCGGDGGSASTASMEKRTESCEKGEGELEVADVLPEAPSGHEIVKADLKALKPLTDPMKQTLGSRLRNFRARAVVPKGDEFGTAVVIFNANEAVHPEGKDVIQGAKESAKEEGAKYEEITVAGNKAAFVQYGDVYQVAVGVGRCSVAMLIDQDRKRIRAVADLMQEPVEN